MASAPASLETPAANHAVSMMAVPQGMMMVFNSRMEYLFRISAPVTVVNGHCLSGVVE
ncbi:MAG: hypothetical protein NTW21_30305 [Verrucomicrobia bacterium]|nr:hypothetical protein [Verrucomicrobiota bacterium]